MLARPVAQYHLQYSCRGGAFAARPVRTAACIRLTCHQRLFASPILAHCNCVCNKLIVMMEGVQSLWAYIAMDSVHYISLRMIKGKHGFVSGVYIQLCATKWALKLCQEAAPT